MGLALVRIRSVASRISASSCAGSNPGYPGRNSKGVATQSTIRRSPSLTSHSCQDRNVLRSLSALESRFALWPTKHLAPRSKDGPGSPCRSPERSRWAAPLSCDHAIYQVRLEPARHAGCPVHRVADEPNAAARQMLDCGNAYVLRQASAHNLPLVESNKKYAAHRFAARLAAAIASPALV